MHNPLVSVNLTTYNRAHLLPRTLNSILAQTYPEIEIVIVDDGSLDNTSEVVSRYQQKDARIKYFRHEQNKGNAFARNTALCICTGYYVAFMDDDDEWIDKDKIRKQVELFERLSDNIAIICTSVALVAEDGMQRKKIVSHPKKLTQHILAGNGIIYSPTVMTKRSIMSQIGGFDLKMPRGIDSDFYRTCIVKFGYDVYFMEDVTTAVHEYGEGRITPSQTRRVLAKNIYANSYLIKKYFKHYLFYPKSFAKRMRTILILFFRYMKSST